MTIDVETLGNGNCLFNGIGLRLLHLIVSGKLDNHPAQNIIIDIFKEVLPSNAEFKSKPTWEKLKGYLASFAPPFNSSAEDIRNKLEIPLARALRNLACNLLKLDDGSNAKAERIDHTSIHLCAAFDEYAKSRTTAKKGNQYKFFDDVFNSHEFIRKKFQALYDDDNIEYAEIKNNLRQWWKDPGFDTFAEQMKVDGTNAGHLEASLIADYLSLNFDYIENGVRTKANHHTDNSKPVILLKHTPGHWDCKIENDEHQDWLKPLFKNPATKAKTGATSLSIPNLNFSPPPPFVLPQQIQQSIPTDVNTTTPAPLVQPQTQTTLSSSQPMQSSQSVLPVQPLPTQNPLAQQGLFSSRPKTPTSVAQIQTEQPAPIQPPKPAQLKEPSAKTDPVKTNPVEPPKAPEAEKNTMRVVAEVTKVELKKIFESIEGVKDCHFDNWPAKFTYKSDEIKIDKIDKKTPTEKEVLVFTAKSNNFETLKMMAEGAKKAPADSIHDSTDFVLEISIPKKELREQLIKYLKDQRIPYEDITPKASKETTDSAKATEVTTRALSKPAL